MHGLFLPGLALALLACVAWYLASPHQRMWARPLPALPSRIAGGVLVAAALALVGQGLQPAPAAFTVLTWIMLWLVLLPYLGLLRHKGAA